MGLLTSESFPLIPSVASDSKTRKNFSSLKKALEDFMKLMSLLLSWINTVGKSPLTMTLEVTSRREMVGREF